MKGMSRENKNVLSHVVKLSVQLCLKISVIMMSISLFPVPECAHWPSVHTSLMPLESIWALRGSTGERVDA